MKSTSKIVVGNSRLPVQGGHLALRGSDSQSRSDICDERTSHVALVKEIARGPSSVYRRRIYRSDNVSG